MTSHLIRRAAGISYLVLIAALTLTPSGDAESVGSLALCLLCGDRGVADALLNVLLFAPLGALLVDDLGRTRAVVACVALSMFIETSQMLMPGRHPSPADVLFNALGGGLGVIVLGQARDRWLVSRSSRQKLAWAWVCCSVMGVALTGVLLARQVVDGPLKIRWTPSSPGGEYGGTVVHAQLGDVVLAEGAPMQPDRVRELLLGHATLVVDFVVGPPPPQRVPALLLTDEEDRFLFAVAVAGQDLWFRPRYRADDLLLDRPEYHLPLALADYREGDTVSVRLTPATEGGYRVDVDATAYGPLPRNVHPERRVGSRHLGFTVGRGWALLLFSPGFPPWFSRAADLTLLALAGLAVGALAGRGSMAVGAAALTLAFVLTPRYSSLVATPAPELLGFLAGVALSWTLRRASSGTPPFGRWMGRRHARPSEQHGKNQQSDIGR